VPLSAQITLFGAEQAATSRGEDERHIGGSARTYLADSSRRQRSAIMASTAR
jgi:hypothetical protein